MFNIALGIIPLSEACAKIWNSVYISSGLPFITIFIFTITRKTSPLIDLPFSTYLFVFQSPKCYESQENIFFVPRALFVAKTQHDTPIHPTSLYCGIVVPCSEIKQ